MTDPSNGTVDILNMNTGYSATKTYRYTPNTNYNGTIVLNIMQQTRMLK